MFTRDTAGLFPELASRDHIRYLRPLVDKTVAASGLDLIDVDAVAYTTGPGLLGALLVGATLASRSLFRWIGLRLGFTIWRVISLHR